jgi:hypothetical protein
MKRNTDKKITKLNNTKKKNGQKSSQFKRKKYANSEKKNGVARKRK